MRQSGFTLVEVAVVLVIIGLIVGGVMMGQNLVRAAQLNQVITDMDKYQSAVETFQFKYESLPGDMPDAENFWPAASTDNGDGDGVIDSNPETIDLWNHLGLAGIISGSYSAAATTLTAGTSTPDTGKQHIYSMSHYCSIAACSNWASTAIGPARIMLVGVSGTTISAQYAGVTSYVNSLTGFTNEDAYSIDGKLDDGMPLSGIFLAPVCSDLAAATKTFATGMNADNLLVTNTSLNYRISDTGKNCFFLMKF